MNAGLGSLLRLLSLGALCLLLCQCRSDNRVRVVEHDEGDRPAWYDHPPANDGEYVYAVGVARERLTESEAERIAFLDGCAKIAASVSVDVAEEIRSTMRTGGSPNTSGSDSSTADAGSGSSVAQSAVARQVLRGAERKETFRQKVEVNPSDFPLASTDTSNLRWDAYMLVAFPRERYDGLLRRADRAETAVDDFDTAVDDVSSSSPDVRARGLAALERLTNRYPENETYRLALARGYLKDGKVREARGLLEGLARSRNPAIRDQARGLLSELETGAIETPRGSLEGQAYRVERTGTETARDLASALAVALEEAGARTGSGGTIRIESADLGEPSKLDEGGRLSVLRGSLAFDATLMREGGSDSRPLAGSVEQHGTDASTLRTRLMRAASTRIVALIAEGR